MPSISEISGARGVWLLDMDVQGRAFRFASESVSVTETTAGGSTTHRYASGLAPVVWQAAAGGSDASYGIEIHSSIDWALLVARGMVLHGQPALLRRWYTGTELARADVVLKGVIDSPRYGAAHDAFSFTLLRLSSRLSQLIPDASAVVNEDTWPDAYNIAPKALGAAYPVVIGCPGHDPNIATPRAAVPALACDFANGTEASKVLISDRKVHASSVWLYNITDRTNAAQTVNQQDDQLGRQVSYCSFAGPHVALGNDDGDNEYWVGFQDDATYGGGVTHRGSLVRGVGSVFEWLADEYFDFDVDRGRLAQHRLWLDAYKVDTFVNKPVSAWKWFESTVLSMLQVMVLEGNDGLYIQPLKYDATELDAVRWLDADRRDVRRDGPLEWRRDEIRNQLTLRYRKVRDTDKWHSILTLAAKAGKLHREPGDGNNDRVYGSFICDRSQRLYRTGSHSGVYPWEGSSAAVWDDPTAGLILRAMADRFALPKRAARYIGGLTLETLQIGDVVILDDDEVHLTGHVCLVMGRQTSADEVALDLLLLDHPVIDDVSTS